jgi:hypothetical protein
MDQRHKSGVTRESAAERAMREAEVLRANGELAAYFKGRRTEREARAALKTIKAFSSQPGATGSGQPPAAARCRFGEDAEEGQNRKAAGGGGGRHRRTPPRKAHGKPLQERGCVE